MFLRECVCVCVCKCMCVRGCTCLLICQRSLLVLAFFLSYRLSDSDENVGWNPYVFKELLQKSVS